MKTPVLVSRPAGERRPLWRPVLLALGLWLTLFRPAAAQVDTYTLAASQGTFTPLTGGTLVADMAADTYLSPALPLGFTFVFDGTAYTEVKASSNGWLSFNTAGTTNTSGTLAAAPAAARPLIAPLLDDLDGRPAGANGEARYQTTGTAPNRVFTFEWINWEWRWSANVPVLSFQVKLYEGSNQVELIYRQESGATTATATLGASIGLAGAGTGAGSFLALSDATASPTASSTTENTNINTKPATGQVYRFTPAPPAACPAPRSLAVASVTSTTANLTWTVAGGGGTFRVEYGPQGFTPGQGTTVTAATPSVTLTGLTPARAYQFYVTQVCGGTSGNSTAAGPASFTTAAVPPANDECANAVTLTPGALNATCAAATSGTLLGATATAGLAAPVGTADDDVWYQFRATATAHTVTLTGSGDYVQQLLGGSCATLTPLAFSDPNTRVYSGLTVNTTYYVRVYSFSATPPTATAAPFTICVTTPTPPPVNDDPCGAITVPVTADCSAPVAGTNELATTTPVSGYVNPGCGIAASPLDVWYKFTTAASGFSSTAVSVTVTGNPAGQVRVFSATSCAGPFTQVGCKAGTGNNTSAGTLDLSGLTPSTTYYVFVSGYGSGDTTGPFTICVAAPAPCPSPRALAATALTSTSATLTWTVQAGTGPFTVYYGPTGFTPVTQGTTVTATTTSLTISNLTPVTDYQFYVVQNCGGTAGNSALSAPASFTTLAVPPANDECANATTLPVPRGTGCVTPLTTTNVGATASAGVADPACADYSGGDVWFRLTVPANGIVVVETDSITSSPVRDTGLAIYSGSCGSLTELDCNDDGSPNGLFSLITLTGRTPGEVLYVRAWEFGNNVFGRFKVCARTPSDCPEPTGLTVANITTTSAALSWTSPGGSGTFTVEYGPQGFTPGSAQGTRLTGIAATNVTLTGLAPTTAYQVYVTQVCGGTTGSSTAVGPVSFSTVPTNDNPTGAIVLTLRADCTTPQTGTNGSATTTTPNGYTNPSCGITTTPRDVWFKFTTPASGRGSTEATLTIGGAATQVRLFSAPSDAGPFTQLSCAAAPNATAPAPALTNTALTPNTTYYVLVANARAADPLGAFTICLTAPSNCPVPAGLTTTAITATTADLAWAVNATTPSGTFELEYGLQGFTLGQGTRVTGITGTAYTLTGLTADRDYCFYVRQNCGPASGSSVYTGPACFRTALAPATNNDPCSAVVLPLTGAVLQATNLGATTTTPNGYVNPGCSTSNNPKDVWFRLTPASSGSVSIATTGTPAGQARLFSAASCTGPFTQLPGGCKASAGSNQNLGSFTVNGLQGGTTYYLMVAGFGSNDLTGSFTLSASMVTSTRNELPGGTVRVFPNPSSTGQVTLQLTGAEGVASVRAALLNGLGQRVAEQTVAVRGGAAEAPLAVHGLARGVYTLRLQVGQYTITRKVVLD